MTGPARRGREVTFFFDPVKSFLSFSSLLLASCRSSCVIDISRLRSEWTCFIFFPISSSCWTWFWNGTNVVLPISTEPFSSDWAKAGHQVNDSLSRGGHDVLPKGLILRKFCVWRLCMFWYMQICVKTDFVVFREFVVWWLVWRVNRRQIEVCFSPDVILCGWLGSKYQLTN